MNATLLPRRSRLATLLLVLLPSLLWSKDLDILKNNTDRWIDIRSRSAKEAAQWEADKTILAATITTLTSSEEAVERSLAYFGEQFDKLAKETEAERERLAGHAETNAFLAEKIFAYEQRIKQLVPKLPQPLIDQLQPLLGKVSSQEDAPTAPLPNRLQNLVAIMTLIDEFNNRVTLSHTIKTLESGESLDVRVLYWGLAIAYAVNGDGTRAWVLSPDQSGWSWRDATANAVEVKRLFDVYDKHVDPVMVSLPFAFQEEEGGAK